MLKCNLGLLLAAALLAPRWADADERPADANKPGLTIVPLGDVTPGWHPPTKKVIAIGAQVRYSRTGAQLEDQPRAHQTAYAVFDPETSRSTKWRRLEMPEAEEFKRLSI